MGLRGPGARPIKRPGTDGKKPRRKAPPWARKGLSRAERVIAFCEHLKITSGPLADQKMRLRAWQREIVAAIYATGADDKRQVRTALVTMPRKNGKTGLAAALALCHLVGPESEPRGQVYSAAADRSQAAIIFAEMKAAILADPALAARVVIRDFNKELEDTLTGSTYKALSADARTKHGFSASFVVYDELAQAPNRELYDVLTTSTAARAEPLTVVISTQSPDPHHVMSELVAYGQQVRDGIINDPTFHATIYSAPPDADPWSEDTWRASNPALGDFRSLEEMRSAAKQAQRIPAREATFRLLYLNQPIDADARFIASADWRACQGPVDPAALAGRPCWAGLDLSSTRDLSALVLFFPEDGGAVMPFFWCPADELDNRERNDRVPYATWARQGLIEATPGRSIDKRYIVRRLAEIRRTYDLRCVAFDRWGTAELRRIMADEGLELPLVDFGQGYKDQSPAIAALESAILDRRLRHDGHPVLAWCMSNVVLETDAAENRKLSKSRAKERIDGAAALAMAVGVHAKQPVAEKEIEISAGCVLVA